MSLLQKPTIQVEGLEKDTHSIISTPPEFIRSKDSDNLRRHGK